MADQHEHGHEAGHDEVRVEESSLSNLGIFGFILLTAAVFFGSAGVLITLFYRITDDIIADKAAETGVPELRALRAQEEERLTTYGYVDKDKGIVRIPIDVAMQKVVEDAKK